MAAAAPLKYPFKKTLKKGDKGRDVEVMQDWLQMASDYLDLGFNMNVNGKFDFNTMLALCTFQRTFMTETGVYDYDTYYVLEGTVASYVQSLNSGYEAQHRWGY